MKKITNFLSEILQAITIMVCFFVFVWLPSLKPTLFQEKYTIFSPLNSLQSWLFSYNKMQFEIMHLPSLGFVVICVIVIYFLMKIKYNFNGTSSISEAEAANKSFADLRDEKISFLELEKLSQKNKIIKKILNFMQKGALEEDLTLYIKALFLEVDNAKTKSKNDYEYLATITPILGMIGTIAGLLMMFATPSEAEGFEQKFAGLSLALSTTLYASLMTILLFKPLAKSVENAQLDIEESFEKLEIETRILYHHFYEYKMSLEDEIQDENLDENKQNLNENLENLEENQENIKAGLDEESKS